MAEPSAPNPTRRPICVVVSSLGKTPDAALLGALDRHGLQARPVSSAHGAMAELCRPANRGSKRVLLIADEGARAAAERVLRAAKRYAPETACWMYEPGANPPLRAHVEAGAAAAEASPEEHPVRSERAPTGSPMLRLIAADEPMPATNGLGEDEEPTAERVLSTDELTMLLAEDEKKGRKP
ncbi:MAG: hypothetical protein RIB60_09885 [Phycisphaerales bacterium]